MNKKYLSVAVIIVIALLVTTAAVFLKKSTQKVGSPDTPIVKTELASKEEVVPTQAGDTAANEARYLPFSPEILSNSADARRVLFFYANWCPICLPADKSFSENISQIPLDATLIRINYNDTDTDQIEKDLAKKYGVTYQHTFVQIDSDGNEITRWNGGSIDELLENIR